MDELGVSKKNKSKKQESGDTKAAPSNPPNRPGNHSKSWYETHGRDLRFLMLFGIFMCVYYIITTTQIMEKQFFPWYLNQTAYVSGQILRLTGFDIAIDGNSIDDLDNRGSITVERGCDAVAPTALFVSAVLASPVPWMLKFPAMFGGVFILMVMNVFRIVTLYITRIYWTKMFDIMHLDVWQAAFIFLAIMLWAFWAAWTTKRLKRPSDVST